MPEEFAALSPEVQLKVRDALIFSLDLIESFAAENPANLSDDELDIVRSWRYLVHGKFYVFRELAKYTVNLLRVSLHRFRGVYPTWGDSGFPFQATDEFHKGLLIR